MSESRRFSRSDSGVDTTAAQVSVLLLWGTGAEIAVAGAGDDAGRSAAGGGEHGTPAKDGGRSCRRPAGRQGVRYFGEQLLVRNCGLFRLKYSRCGG